MPLRSDSVALREPISGVWISFSTQAMRPDSLRGDKSAILYILCLFKTDPIYTVSVRVRGPVYIIGESVRLCLCICVSVCVRMCVYIFMCVRICLCIYLCVCICVSVCVRICVCVYLCICVCSHVCVSVCVRIYVCVCCGNTRIVRILF